MPQRALRVALRPRPLPLGRCTQRVPGMQATCAWLHASTVRGRGRGLRRYHLRVRSARVRQSGPDPDDGAKGAYLEQGLRDAAHHPQAVGLGLLDELGEYHGPEGART